MFLLFVTSTDICLYRFPCPQVSAGGASVHKLRCGAGVGAYRTFNGKESFPAVWTSVNLCGDLFSAVLTVKRRHPALLSLYTENGKVIVLSVLFQMGEGNIEAILLRLNRMFKIPGVLKEVFLQKFVDLYIHLNSVHRPS